MSFGKKTLTLFKAISLALIAACLMTLFMIWLGASEKGALAGVGVFSTSLAGMYTSFWSVMLIINAILFILVSALAVFGLLLDKNLLALPLPVIGFLLFFLTLFQKLFIGESELHLGAGPWLILFLSLLAFGATLLDNLANEKKLIDLNDLSVFGIKLSSGPKQPRGTWTCPTCGAVLSAALRFCDRCGTQKPEPPRCPTCGKFYRPGEAFCANCGTPLS